MKLNVATFVEVAVVLAGAAAYSFVPAEQDAYYGDGQDSERPPLHRRSLFFGNLKNTDEPPITENQCTATTCKNGGTCFENEDSVFCTCPAGFTGDECETQTTPGCTPNPCQNGGTCTEDSNGVVCTCPAGYTGNLCQITTTTPSPVHLYKGEDNADDSVGGADGTLGSATQFGAGVDGKCFDLNGNLNSPVTGMANINPSHYPMMTMGLHVKLRSINNNRGWALSNDDSGFDRAIILHDTRFGLNVAAGVGFQYASTLPAVSLNVWHCVAVAYDDVNDKALVYYDGSTELISSTFPGVNGGESNNLAALDNPRFGNHEIDGLIDEVFIYDQFLDKDMIDTACAGPLP